MLDPKNKVQVYFHMYCDQVKYVALIYPIYVTSTFTA